MCSTPSGASAPRPSSSTPRPTRSTARSPAPSTSLRDGRYAYINRPFGIGESEPLDFLSPYGCSKGAADQYALDFARIYQIPATSFRQSCIYGPRQFGVEDQGWVAWFAIASLLGRDITIYGDGRQVRDVLHVEDLVRAYEAAIRSPDKVAAQAFNVGGGPSSILSLLDLVEMLEERLKRRIPLRWDDWRPGDQRVYVSDIRKLETVLGWKPEIDVDDRGRAAHRLGRAEPGRFLMLGVSPNPPARVCGLPRPMVA